MGRRIPESVGSRLAWQVLRLLVALGRTPGPPPCSERRHAPPRVVTDRHTDGAEGVAYPLSLEAAAVIAPIARRLPARGGHACRPWRSGPRSAAEQLRGPLYLGKRCDN
jgi:hypothetical protein